MFDLSRIARRATGLLAGLSFVTILAPAVAVAAPPTTTLNPPPPDYYTCKDGGGGTTICRGVVESTYDLEPTGIICGAGAGAFEVLDSGLRVSTFTRYYDRDGNIVRRRRSVDFFGAHVTNPLTGTVVPYRQKNPDWEQFTVPGDLSGGETYYGHGFLQFTVPGMGSVLHESGVVVVNGTLEDGVLLARHGPSDLSDYFAGDASVVADLCKALGA